MNKFLSKGELIGILLIGLLSVVMGGYTVIPMAVIAGAMIGLTASSDKFNFSRSAILGLVASGVVVLGAVIHNIGVVKLPKIEAIGAGGDSPLVYVIALVLGVVAAIVLSRLKAIQNNRVRQIGLLLFLLVCAIAFPFYDQKFELFWASVIITAMIFTLQALGLNIVAGFAGLLDLGYVAFFAIGGYTVAFLRSPHFEAVAPPWLTNMPFPAVVIIAGLAAGLFGFLLGAPTLPLRGDYLAIVTLGFGEIVPIIFKNLDAVKIYEPISRFIAMLGGNNNGGICLFGCGDIPINLTNGTQGISAIKSPAEFFRVDSYIPWYFLILVLLVVSVFFINHLRDSRIGRSFIAMREDELAASAMGIPIVRTKLTAFTLGAVFSGIAGAFYGSYVKFVDPGSFDFSISVIVLCMVILGGSGSITGVILGSFLITLTDRLLLDKLQVIIRGLLEVTLFQAVKVEALNNFMASLFDATQYKLLLFGVILVVMMLVRPQGLVPERIKKTQKA